MIRWTQQADRRFLAIKTFLQNQMLFPTPGSSTFVGTSSMEPPFAKMHTLQDMDRVEEELRDNERRQLTVTFLAKLRGDNVHAYADRVIRTLFDDDITAFMTFTGRGEHKRAFDKSFLFRIVSEAFELWCVANKGNADERHSALMRAL
ncbi:unnamed protein product [Dibothriocephalus latus]|uniref:DUF4806 domain-containing protein n=1 Tax=Dibothriocephalus latus TaxID=60516 RepID=A0A3P6UKF7_DIBLA|nr:unnamed protein product [Dibothriocephalus latus]